MQCSLSHPQNAYMQNRVAARLSFLRASAQVSHLGGVRSQRGDDVTAEVSDDAQVGVPVQALCQLSFLHYGLPNTDTSVLEHISKNTSIPSSRTLRDLSTFEACAVHSVPTRVSSELRHSGNCLHHASHHKTPLAGVISTAGYNSDDTGVKKQDFELKLRR